MFERVFFAMFFMILLLQYVQCFSHPSQLPPVVKPELPSEARARKKSEKEIAHAKELMENIGKWNPKEIKNATENPLKTLFVGRLAYSVTDADLKKEMEHYGKVKTVRMVMDKSGKSRGYAFVEFEHSADFKDALRGADGRKIQGRRVVVDVERGRTVPTWKPRRLGGGLGGTRIGSKSENITTSGRFVPASDRGRSRSRSPRRDRRDDRDYRERDRDRERPSHHSRDYRRDDRR